MMSAMQGFSLLWVLEISSKQHCVPLVKISSFIQGSVMFPPYSSKFLTSVTFEVYETRQFLPSFQQVISSTPSKAVNVRI